MKRLIIAGAILGMVACTSRPEAAPPPAEATLAAASPLYFSLEIRRDGELLAKPKLLGEVDKPLRAERRPPGAPVADYQLVLLAQPEGDRYHLTLDVTLPDAKGHGEVALGHGGIRKLELGDRPGALQVSVTLMRVDSPEFRALMDLSEQDQARDNTGSI